ncbi:MAG: MFS transporter [Candidatus Omnitrophota bacterium]
MLMKLERQERKKAGLKQKLNSNYIWTFTTYFTEGFPYAMIRSVSAVFFRDMKAPLSFVGLTSLFGIPWILKFLWGPWVDEFGTKRRWLVGMQAPLLVVFLAAAVFAPFGNNVYLIYGLFFIGSFIAASNDTAIDGYYLEALSKEDQSKFVGYRNMAYRLSWMCGTGVIVTLGATAGWPLAFLIAAVIFGLFVLYHLFFLPEIQVPEKRIGILLARVFRFKVLAIILAILAAAIGIQYYFQSPGYARLTERISFLKKMELAHWAALLLLLALILVGIFIKRFKQLLVKNPDSNYGKAFITFMDKEKIGVILSFIILLRLGEWVLSNMVSPFIVDLGIKVHYGWISAGVGLPLSITGTMVGGWMIARYSLKRMIWPFILIQNFIHVFYTLLAVHLQPFVALNTGAAHPVPIGFANLIWVAGVNGFDQFAGGLGSSVLITYLMRICHKDHKASHYAIGTGLMAIPAPFAGVFSGIIAGWLGYAWLFGISFVLAIPGMMLIPFLPYLSDEKLDMKGSTT